ncbi:MAG: hypothetical protein FWF84_03415, partial [Kiritimatiellaeota bacterium]|nr:hypothetical protein [Kiritimatiellota bacterium]
RHSSDSVIFNFTQAGTLMHFIPNTRFWFTKDILGGASERLPITAIAPDGDDLTLTWNAVPTQPDAFYAVYATTNLALPFAPAYILSHDDVEEGANGTRTATLKNATKPDPATFFLLRAVETDAP